MRNMVAAGLLAGLGLRELLHWPRAPAEQGRPCEHIVIAVRAESPELLMGTVAHLCGLAPTIPITIVSPEDRPAEWQAPPQVQFIRFECDGSKGALVNALVASGVLDDTTRVTIYDADSRPTGLRHAAGADRPASQQLSLYRAPPHAGPFWQGCAANQTAWALGYEHRRLKGSRTHYLVGHGLTINVEELRRRPLRPSLPGEDLLLGYQLSVAGCRTAVSPAADVAGIPETVPEFVRQSGRWFAGEVSALAAVARTASPSSRLVTLLAGRTLGLLFWLVGPWLILPAAATLARGSRLLKACAVAAALCRVARWLATEQRDTPRVGGPLAPALRVVGFNAKPVLASVGALWALSRHVLTGTMDQMPKARPWT